MKKEIIVQTLPCVLTREELEDRSKRLKEKENSDLRRRLANVEEYCRRALA